MKKIFILGLDGLEYNFVEEWDLTHLKQKEYGKIVVPIDRKLGVPNTPEVWASFLTGEHIRLSFEDYNTLSPVHKILKFLRKYINVSLGLSKKIRKRVLGVHGFPRVKLKTFLDIKESKMINVPYYNYDGKVLTVTSYFGAERLSLEQTIKLLEGIYKVRKKQIINGIDFETADILFAYMHFPDALQHFLFVKPSKIKNLYIDLNKFVYDLKSRIPNSVLFLIISDHGFELKEGIHSKHGFYSSNKPLSPKPTNITDFYGLITKMLE